MAERITIDIAILQGIFGDLIKLQQQLTGVAGGVAAVDRTASSAFSGVQQSVKATQGSLGGLDATTDNVMRNMMQDIMGPTARAQELNQKLTDLGTKLRTSKSVGEITKLKQEISATQKELDRVNTGGMEQKVSGGASRMRSMFSSLVAPIAGVFAVGAITAFAGGVVQAAGAQQQFSVALESMLQSKGRADELTAQVKKFATATPFELTEVQDSTKSLLALGFSAKDVIPTLTRLGDVSAGLGQPVGEIAYLYGTARTQGRLFTNDLNQFTNRGIPIVDELSKVLGVSASKVRELTEEGKVGFPALEQVFKNLTAQGSKFGGLMEKQSHTITGQLSNLSDGWNQFRSDMGLSLAPLITGVIAGLGSAMDVVRNTFAWLEEHGPLVKGVLTGIAVVTGIYTAALLVNNAGLIANNALQAVAALRMGVMATVMNVVTAATTVWTGVQWLLNAALDANPIGLVVLAIAALVGGIVYAWNHFEGFRGVVMGLWEVMKQAFSWVAAFVQPIIGAVVDYFKFWWSAIVAVWDVIVSGIQVVGGWFGQFWQWISGFKDKVVDAFSSLADILLAPFMAVFKVLSLIPGVDKLIGKAKEVGESVGQAFSMGRDKAVVDFQADAKPDAKAVVPFGTTNAKAVVPGSDVGAASLVGGSPQLAAVGAVGATGTGTGKGGSGGGDRTISMNITMNNHFGIGRNTDTDAKGAAEKVIGALVNKLRDAELAIG